MKTPGWLASSVVGLILVLGVYSGTAQATLRHKKETGKRCSFCHTGIPKSGAEDKRLTEDGKKFRENSYRLTEEQRNRPEES
jgi:hypothetical protein